ncbi:MAG: HD domain-containing protein [Bacilli bacterium]|nr:HD domain-containing protein [Bacilli bacterium]
MLDYNYVENKFNNYVSSCFQQARDFCGYSEINKKNACLYEKKISLMSSSFQHSLRVVRGLLELSRMLKIPEYNKDLIKTIGLIHDYGRYKQAIIHTSFNDHKVFANKSFKNHAEYGFVLLEEQHGFQRLGIEEKYHPVIGTCIAFHHKEEMPSIFTNEVVSLLQNKDFEKIIKGSYDFTQEEINLITLLLQMLTDIDRIDNLYQFAIKQRKYIKINKISDIESLKVNIEFKEKIFVDDMTLDQLKNYENYNFIYNLWWSITKLLRNLNFTASIQIIESQKILDKIYEQYPSNFHPIINEIFTFAESKLIEEKIKENKNSIYIRRKERK